MCSTVATNCFLRSVIINEELMYAGHIIFFRVPGEKATWRICTYTLIKYYKKRHYIFWSLFTTFWNIRKMWWKAMTGPKEQLLTNSAPCYSRFSLA